MSDSLDKLNAEQLAAVNADGNILLVSCPGSGKTRTLIHKIARELAEVDSHRQFVIALTYTHVAANEVEDRISGMGISTDQLWVGTIHSFCLEWIIRPYAIYHPALRDGFRVIDTFDQEVMLDSIAKQHGLRSRFDCSHFATSTGYEIDLSTSQRNRPLVIAAVEQYHEELNALRAIDFEMMLKYAADLIRDNKQIAQRLSRLFRLIAVDEYQDTREIQYQILACIFRATGSSARLFMVGDPNQAIFTSLGGLALPHEELTGMTGLTISEMSLSQNYRSSEERVDYFSRFQVSPMDIVASGHLRDWSGNVTYNRTVDRSQLPTHLEELIRYNIETLHIDPSEICVVAPFWIHLASVTRALVRSMPEYEFNGPGLTPFGENRDNFWFKLARISLTEASPRHFYTRLRWAQEVIDLLVECRATTDDLAPRTLLRFSNSVSLDTQDGVKFLRDFFDAFLNEYSISLDTHEGLKHQHDSFFERMHNRISRVERDEGVSLNDLETFKKVFRPKSGVTVSTVHGVKGAEFDTVIAFALYEGALPHFNEPDKTTAANRSLFVISSRARKNLHLISERGRFDYRGDEQRPTQVLAAAAFDYSNEVA
ncbi:ATP-dependent helicase [Nesterenkonia sp. AY15]|uniref:UvrD-helicase domain-containing protein n=1 Tax=Nesterenkonia sp. AY15 TaxID=2901139 RepID=UPI001F4CAB42|nr:ATP-dependent helicase [Nesterenkonia sp. AY15]MCH8570247.1 ATP-dependent helicase [Nesterenkonia sp. AY15]